LAFGIDNLDGRVLRFITGLNDDLFFVSGLLIRLFTESNSFNNGVEFNLTRKFGNNHGIIWIPIDQFLAFLDFLPIFYKKVRTVRNNLLVHDFAISIDNLDFARTTQYNMIGSFVTLFFYGTYVFEFYCTFVLGNDGRFGSNIGCCTPNVERTKCQLCTWLTDRLCGDDTHSFTQLYTLAGS